MSEREKKDKRIVKMELMYTSTRNANEKVTASQAILKGLAEDGGLFVPEQLPTLDKTVDELAGMTYQETAYEVMKKFLTDFTEEELKNCINALMTASLIQKRSHHWFRRTERIIWSCSMAQRLLLKIWHYPSCHI